ncbi:MAG: hypothetical protein Q4E12_01370 [Coriobacteriia bacterium]|nr:hypothetical protein [Coriobacteriia bacterium]
MYKTMMRRWLIPAVLLLGAALACMAGFNWTTAYLTDTDSAVNTVSISSIDIQIDERFDDPGPVKQGDSFAKEVRITNTGDAAAYVRVMVSFSHDWAQRNTSVDYNTSQWTDVQADGYRYLRDALPKSAQSPALMTTVNVTGTPLQGWSAFDIFVYAEAVQVTNAETGDTYASPQEAFAAYERSV